MMNQEIDIDDVQGPVGVLGIAAAGAITGALAGTAALTGAAGSIAYSGGLLLFKNILGPLASFLSPEYSTTLFTVIVGSMIIPKKLKSLRNNIAAAVWSGDSKLEMFDKVVGIKYALISAAIILAAALGTAYGAPAQAIEYLSSMLSVRDTTVTATLSSLIVFFLGLFSIKMGFATQIQKIVTVACIASTNFVSSAFIIPWLNPVPIPIPEKGFVAKVYNSFVDVFTPDKLKAYKADIESDSMFSFLFVCYNAIISAMSSVASGIYSGTSSFAEYITGFFRSGATKEAGSSTFGSVATYVSDQFISMKNSALGLIETMQNSVVGSNAYTSASVKLQEYITVSDTWFSTNTPTMYNILAYMKSLMVILGNWMNNQLTAVVGASTASYIISPFTFLAVTFGTVYLIYRVYKSRNRNIANEPKVNVELEGFGKTSMIMSGYLNDAAQMIVDNTIFGPEFRQTMLEKTDDTIKLLQDMPSNSLGLILISKLSSHKLTISNANIEEIVISHATLVDIFGQRSIQTMHPFFITGDETGIAYAGKIEANVKNTLLLQQNIFENLFSKKKTNPRDIIPTAQAIGNVTALQY
jgi:hypothetical protein